MVKGSARVVTYAIVRYSEPPGHVWVWVCMDSTACIVLYVCTVCVYVHIVRYSDPQCICGYVQYCIKYGRKFWQGMFLADWQI